MELLHIVLSAVNCGVGRFNQLVVENSIYLFVLRYKPSLFYVEKRRLDAVVYQMGYTNWLYFCRCRSLICLFYH